ncbi:MAG: ATP-dependent sacrificial sulfur transferase LarE, partial [Nannocystaceae bacterium]
TQATELARQLDLAHRCVETHEMARPEYRANAGDRCFHCKSELFERLRSLAEHEGYAHVLSGDNLDDVSPGTHRPGMRAAAAWSVQKPLIEAELGKEDVRALAEMLEIPNHAKVASPCLASRVPHGIAVDRQVLAKIERAESVVRALGFTQFRVRHHGDIARLELAGAELERALSQRAALVRGIKAAGYQWVTLDLSGFRSGSLNVVLQGERLRR